MYPMTDPRRKSLRGAPWDGPSLTCDKKRSPNMGTKTFWAVKQQEPFSWGH